MNAAHFGFRAWRVPASLALVALLLNACSLGSRQSDPGSTTAATSAGAIAVIKQDGELPARRQAAAEAGVLPADALGYFLDVQTARLQSLAQAGVKVNRQAERIVVVIPGANSFASDSTTLNTDSRQLLESLAEVLNEFQQSLVLIGGHSDSQGDPAYNLRLSEQRAMSVARYLSGRGIPAVRLAVRGYGDQQPIADNDTEAGRAANRRIELTIWPLLER